LGDHKGANAMEMDVQFDASGNPTVFLQNTGLFPFDRTPARMLQPLATAVEAEQRPCKP
jgi:hypothetical protein